MRATRGRTAVQWVSFVTVLAFCLACVTRARPATVVAYPPPASYGGGGAVLTVGQFVDNYLAPGDQMLADGRYVDAWRFYGQAGQHVTLMLRSPTLDTYLAVFFGSGSQIIFSDDDSAGNYDAMISAVLPYTGVYMIACTTAPPAIAVNGLRSGTYRLSIMP